METEREERIRRLVEEYGLPEAEARFAVDLADGKTMGDIVGLTDEQRRAWGLDRPIVDLRPAVTPSE